MDFAHICDQHNIEHRLTQVNHTWINGQVEQMNRILKKVTVREDHYQNHQQLKEHLLAFLMSYNFARKLKALKGLTPYELIFQQWIIS